MNYLKQLGASTLLNSEAPTEIQLMPCGETITKDGRTWWCNAGSFAKIKSYFNNREDLLPIDYNHAGEYAAINGGDAPAAGWFNPQNLQWREGVGIFATLVEWTEKAATAIAKKEYKYISPALLINKSTGEVIGFTSAALTNIPAIDGMVALANQDFNQGVKMMLSEETIADLRWYLKLPTLATTEEIAAELTKGAALIRASLPSLATTQFNMFEQVIELATAKDLLNTELATLKAKGDSAVELASLQNKVAQLEIANIDMLVTQAITAGKAINANYLATLATVEMKKAYIDSVPITPVLAGMQSNGVVIAPTTNTAAKNTNLPTGYAVDLASLQRHNKIQAYATVHNISYQQALSKAEQ